MRESSGQWLVASDQWPVSQLSVPADLNEVEYPSVPSVSERIRMKLYIITGHFYLQYPPTQKYPPRRDAQYPGTQTARGRGGIT